MTLSKTHATRSGDLASGAGRPASLARKQAANRGLATVEYLLLLTLVSAGGIAAWRTLGQSAARSVVQHAGNVAGFSPTAGPSPPSPR